MLSARSRWVTRTDLGLLLIVFAMLVVGLVMVYSASYHFPLVDEEFERPPHYFLARQALFALVGLVVLFIASRVDYRLYRRYAVYILLGTIAILFVMALLGRRTIFVKLRSVQPSELAKVGAMVYMAVWLASKGEQLRQFSLGLIPFGVLLGTIAGLIVAQPDISTAAILVVTGSAMFFAAGVDTKQFLVWLMLVGLALVSVVLVVDYAKGRFIAWRPEWFPLEASELGDLRYQIEQSLLALIRGRFLGVGLGQSEQKLTLYAPHSDCLFSIIAEEIGFIGSTIVIGLYALWTWRGLRLAMQVEDTYGALLAVGLVSWVTFQAALHIGALTDSTPLTGTVLPFMSAGGSSLVTLLASVGILVNISRVSRAEGRRPFS